MSKWFYIIAGILVAVMLSQFPEFYQQYRQRLGGTMDELTRQVQALDDRAAATDMTRYNYVRHLKSSKDQAAKQEGEHLTNLLTRHFSVSEAIKELDSGDMKMMFVLAVYHLDKDTAMATAEDYKPAIPLTLESAVYSLIGFIVGYLTMAFLFVFLPRRVLLSDNS